MTDTPQLSNAGPWFLVFHTQNPHEAHLWLQNQGLSSASDSTVYLSWKDVSILLLHSPWKFSIKEEKMQIYFSSSNPIAKSGECLSDIKLPKICIP